MPATQVLQEYFDTDLTVINATIALFVLSMAIAPLFWAPLSERIGRKPVLVVSMAFYTVVTIICAISKNLALFFIMRILQGIFSSAASSVGGGAAADLFFPHERGRAMGSLTLATVLGPAFSPLLGGYITQSLGWRWIFYISTIIGGVVLLADIFLMRETLYRPQQFADREKPKTIKSWLQYLKGLRLLSRLDVFLMSLPTSLGFGWFYFLVTILSPTYNDIHHFSTGSTGLLYLTGGLGNVLGAFIAGQVSDRVYIYIRKKYSNRQISKEARLIPFYVGIPLIVIGYLFYGWFIYARFHWFVPLIGYFMGTLRNKRKVILYIPKEEMIMFKNGLNIILIYLLFLSNAIIL
ncbi:major facilitator superfamily domain-containing protein [Phascolomyces articulosus]|uniref:Major facilitator superfamily domain-containing protein n=1 Tax=Phascolomyces articulosus TaxID=60185 RepID=A0AAD5PCW6_9FUNG|nr:major facilitator superfamily domain-containing protein [Phascolomyces articulosus]